MSVVDSEQDRRSLRCALQRLDDENEHPPPVGRRCCLQHPPRRVDGGMRHDRRARTAATSGISASQGAQHVQPRPERATCVLEVRHECASETGRARVLNGRLQQARLADTGLADKDEDARVSRRRTAQQLADLRHGRYRGRRAGRGRSRGLRDGARTRFAYRRARRRGLEPFAHGRRDVAEAVGERVARIEPLPSPQVELGRPARLDRLEPNRKNRHVAVERDLQLVQHRIRSVRGRAERKYDELASARWPRRALARTARRTARCAARSSSACRRVRAHRTPPLLVAHRDARS